MTMLSVNVNKIALLRNSRGRDFPSVIDFVNRCLDLGVRGITVHPRPDERHVTRQDVADLSALLHDKAAVEFNIEGYPSEAFLQLVLAAKPQQCTLVPDAPGQLTSDHGWDILANKDLLLQTTCLLRQANIRSSLFVDPVVSVIEQVQFVEADRIELYTEEYAACFSTAKQSKVFEKYREAASAATKLGIGINAGHDLNLANLATFLQIPGVLEVSIGHALIVEAIHQGLDSVINQYLAITGN